MHFNFLEHKSTFFCIKNKDKWGNNVGDYFLIRPGSSAAGHQTTLYLFCRGLSAQQKHVLKSPTLFVMSGTFYE